MPKRQLRIVQRENGKAILGVCIRCNAQFKGADMEAQFEAHKCKPVDSSQNALRIVRESTEGK